VSTPAVSATTGALRFAGVSVEVHDVATGTTRTTLGPLDWCVEPGDHWAVVGPNGAGKTTLVDVASGATQPSAGTVTIFGERLGAIGLRDPRLRVGLLEADTPTFARSLRGLAVVVLRSSGPIALRGERIPPRDVERAEELLSLFGCAHLRDRRFGDCSQGERRRIMLARSLMREPDVVLLDEPTAGLDLAGRELFLQAVARLAQRRPPLATVTVTHHVEELPTSTTHVLLLRDGRAVAAGPVAATLTEEHLGGCFAVPVRIDRVGGRWTARARAPSW
jgi:iron complex transport system ATP-binding protein